MARLAYLASFNAGKFLISRTSENKLTDAKHRSLKLTIPSTEQQHLLSSRFDTWPGTCLSGIPFCKCPRSCAERFQLASLCGPAKKDW